MATGDQDDKAATRALYVVRAGGRLFAVSAEEVEAAARDLVPTPLPFAPPAVVGVVSLRGRIRTVVDPLRLSDDDPANDTTHAPAPVEQTPTRDEQAPTRDEQMRPRLFVALTGDEQLALACDAAEGELSVAPSRITPSADPRSHLRGTFEHAGARVSLLDTSRLFDAATRGTERRRKRS